jgi:hypothetical protein
MSVTVKVVQVPGAIRDFALNDGAKVRDALAQAGIEVRTGQLVKLNGNETSLDAPLPNNSTVMVTAKITGNFFRS